ncbi:hypothetical protein LZ30DRAFT_742667 [Colletotrichum cereale]|nr:hypothetical protein LZ30DRAFT_742667 [Colletotrichum cereale]
MKLFSLLTLLCATSVSANRYQCRCYKEGSYDQRSTKTACRKTPNAQMVGGHDCILPRQLPRPADFQRVSNNA